VKLKPIQSVLSEKYIEEKIIQWIVRRFKGKENSEFINHLIECAENDIFTQDIYFPIPFTSSGHEFTLGKFSFKNFDSKVFDEWFSIMKGDDEKIEQLRQKIQRDYQGNLAAKITLTAESEKAKEVGFSELSKTLSILRFVSPAIFHPLWINGTYEYGWNMYESEKVIFFSKDTEKFSMSESIRDSRIYWDIDKKALDFICNGESNKFQELLAASTPSLFQLKLITGLSIYSKSVLKRDISDKLIYVLVALESLLLKNETEPIQQNLSDRIALISTRDPTKRKDTVKLVKDIYAIRSKFMHHGQPTYDQVEILKSFFHVAWLTMNSILDNHKNFKSKEEYLERVDDLKYK
jgi:hypothetical protein